MTKMEGYKTGRLSRRQMQNSFEKDERTHTAAADFLARPQDRAINSLESQIEVVEMLYVRNVDVWLLFRGMHMCADAIGSHNVRIRTLGWDTGARNWSYFQYIFNGVAVTIGRVNN